MLIIVINTILLIVLGLIGKRLYQRHLIAKYINLIPGPPILPIIGNLHYLTGGQEMLWKRMRQFNEEYYPTFRIWSPHWIVVNVRDPDDIEAIFTNFKFIEKSSLYDTVRPWLREGLLTSTGTKWQQRRKILTPAFHFNVLQKYMEVILEQAEKMIKLLKDEGGEPVKNLEAWVGEHTLSVICETAMGTSLQNMKSEDVLKYKTAVHTMGEIIAHRIIRPWLIPDFLFALFPVAIKQRNAIKVLHGFSTKIINERKKYHEDTGGIYLQNFDENSNDDSVYNSSKKRMAMLDLLIAVYNQGQIDDIGMREEVDTFIFEGYDTTATAMCFSILLLAEHSEIQARAREEINEVWKECNGKVGMGEVQKFTYLERCIKEAMRLYPSVPLISRQTRSELKLKNYVVPADVLTNIHIYDLHRDPKYWPNPEVFDPDRFLPENSKGRHPYSYVPFSGGFRNCIGQKFAMMELKTLIGFLLHYYTIEAIQRTCDVRPKADLVFRSINPLHVRFVPIKA